MAAVTALDLITDALQGIGVYAAGEQVSAADADLGLKRLNVMLDSWSNDSLLTYAELEQSAPLVPGQYQYTIGIGGNFNMTRPLRILGGGGTCYVVDTNGNRYNLEVIPRDRWNLIGNIAQVTANFPNTLFYDPQYPLGIVNIYPIPTINWTLYFDSYIQLTDFANLAAPLSLPPGYQAAIQDNLAVEIWRFFKPDTVQIPATTLAIASRSKGNVKRTNMRENLASFDPELISRASGSYNVYTGSNRGAAS